MTEYDDNEDTFDNDTEEQEPHRGYEEDAISKELNKTFEKIQKRNSDEYEESLDLEESDEKEPLTAEKNEKLLNKDTEDKSTVKNEDDYPSTWKGALKDKWATVDPDVRAEIHRREGDMLKGLEQYRSHASYAQEVANTFKPYDAAIRAAGTNQKAVLETALNTMYVLKTGSQQEKANELLNLASAYGIDLGEVNNVNDRILANQPLVDPEVEQLKRENQQILSFLKKSTADKQQEEIQGYASELDQFEADPANRYFADVREEMARIFGSSQEELTLQEVYDKAVWANPVTREKLIVERRETERREAAEKAAGAKRTAKTNVASKGQPLVNVKANGTLEDTMAETWAQIKSRR